MIFDKLLSLLLRKELYMISDYSNKFVGSKKWGLDTVSNGYEGKYDYVR